MEFSEGSITESGEVVEIRWNSGRTQRLSAAFLRSKCACATCRQVKFEMTPQMFPGLQVTETQPVGAYAFQFHFSDGHSHGAFPYATLETFPDQA